MKVWIATLCFAVVSLRAAEARADSMNCDKAPPTEHVFDRQPQDQVQPHHLEIVRPFAASGKLEFQVCNANLRIRARPDARELRLVIDLGGDAGGRDLQTYLQRVQVSEDKGVIALKLPKEAHASVTLEVPMGAGSATELSLGRGDLEFAGSDAGGKREINVGMGDVRLAIGDDTHYASLEVNVGMGFFHDARPGGKNGHLAVAREYAGTGHGSVEVNVGMGKVDIVE